MINDWHIKMDENKGAGFESLEFHPVHVNADFGVTSAAFGNTSENTAKLSAEAECESRALLYSMFGNVTCHPRFPKVPRVLVFGLETQHLPEIRWSRPVVDLWELNKIIPQYRRSFQSSK